MKFFLTKDVTDMETTKKCLSATYELLQATFGNTCQSIAKCCLQRLIVIQLTLQTSFVIF